MRWKSIVAICSLVVAMIVQSPVANAASSYDSVGVVNSILLGKPLVGCDSIDVSTTWPSYLSDAYNDAPTSAAAAIDSFHAALDHGAWAVSSHNPVSSLSDAVYVVWSESDTATTDFAPFLGVPSLIFNPHGAILHDASIRVLKEGGSCVVQTQFSDAWGYSNVDYPGVLSYDSLMGAFDTRLAVFLSTAPVTYPADYEGAQIPSQHTPPTPTYVAMGDSFSSGEGNPPFENGTDTASNKCHRSPQAYPRLLQNDPSLNLGATAFVACSGATTANVLSGGLSGGAWNEDPQIDALSEDTDVVTITIGGNNIGFSNLANACVYGSCASSSSEYQESWEIMTDLTRADYLPIWLASLFSDISYSLYLNPDVKVFVVGYPYVMTHASWEDRGLGICSDFDEDEATAVEDIVSKLDTVIHKAVTNFDDSRFIYVDPLATGSPFLGHELCRGGAYFNGTEAGLNDPAYVFHPNGNGQQAYADLIKSYMD